MKALCLAFAVSTLATSSPSLAAPRGRTGIDRSLRNQIEEIWGKGRIALVDETYADAVVDHMPAPGQPPGRSAMKRVVTEFRAGLPDTRMRLHKILQKGKFGVDVWTMTATQTGPLFGHPSTGKSVRISGIDMVRVDQGKIVDLWHVEEMLQLRQQLGFGAPSAVTSGESTPPEPVQAGAWDPGAEAAVPSRGQLNRLERRNLKIARRHIEEIWAKGEVALAYKLYARNVVDHNPAPGQRPGIDGIVDVLGWLRKSIPNLQMSIKRYLVDGEYAVDRWQMRGTHTGIPLMGIPARGKAIEISGMDVIHIRADGRISDVWHVEDFERLLAQISS